MCRWRLLSVSRVSSCCSCQVVGPEHNWTGRWRWYYCITDELVVSFVIQQWITQTRITWHLPVYHCIHLGMFKSSFERVSDSKDSRFTSASWWSLVKLLWLEQHAGWMPFLMQFYYINVNCAHVNCTDSSSLKQVEYECLQQLTV